MAGEVELQKVRAAALREAADYAEFYANERMTLCGDSILHDPVLSRASHGKMAGLTVAELERSRQAQIDGTINSAAYHAATNIAEHLRARADKIIRGEV